MKTVLNILLVLFLTPAYLQAQDADVEYEGSDDYDLKPEDLPQANNDSYELGSVFSSSTPAPGGQSRIYLFSPLSDVAKLAIGNQLSLDTWSGHFLAPSEYLARNKSVREPVPQK